MPSEKNQSEPSAKVTSKDLSKGPILAKTGGAVFRDNFLYITLSSINGCNVRVSVVFKKDKTLIQPALPNKEV